MSFHSFARWFIFSIYTTTLSSFFTHFPPPSLHFVQWMVFRQTAPLVLRMDLRQRPGPLGGLECYSEEATGKSSFHLRKWMRPFQLLCGTPAFSFRHHHCFFILSFFFFHSFWNKAGHLIKPFIYFPLIFPLCATQRGKCLPGPSQCPWAAGAQLRDVFDATSLCVSSSSVYSAALVFKCSSIYSHYFPPRGAEKVIIWSDPVDLVHETVLLSRSLWSDNIMSPNFLANNVHFHRLHLYGF